MLHASGGCVEREGRALAAMVRALKAQLPTLPAVGYPEGQTNG
jgi:hypothetical protein